MWTPSRAETGQAGDGQAAQLAPLVEGPGICYWALQGWDRGWSPRVIGAIHPWEGLGATAWLPASPMGRPQGRVWSKGVNEATAEGDKQGLDLRAWGNQLGADLGGSRQLAGGRAGQLQASGCEQARCLGPLCPGAGRYSLWVDPELGGRSVRRRAGGQIRTATTTRPHPQGPACLPRQAAVAPVG